MTEGSLTAKGGGRKTRHRVPRGGKRPSNGPRYLSPHLVKLGKTWQATPRVPSVSPPISARETRRRIVEYLTRKELQKLQVRKMQKLAHKAVKRSRKRRLASGGDDTEEIGDGLLSQS